MAVVAMAIVAMAIVAMAVVAMAIVAMAVVAMAIVAMNQCSYTLCYVTLHYDVPCCVVSSIPSIARMKHARHFTPWKFMSQSTIFFASRSFQI